MARGHGRILTSIWEDADFLALDERGQRLYLFLISQPNLNHAGLLDLTLRRWSRKATGLTVAELKDRIATLEAARFIVVDDDTEELLIRTFVRNDGVWRMPKVMGAMVSGALEISSKKLQAAMLAEMDRIPLDDLSDEPTKLRTGGEGPSIRQQVSEQISILRRAFHTHTPDPTEDGSTTPFITPSGTPSEPPAEGGPKGSTRGRAPTSRAHSPAPAPSPTPAPGPSPSPREASTDLELPAVAEDKQPLPDRMFTAWWTKYRRSTAQGRASIQSAITAALSNGIDPDELWSALCVLGDTSKPVTGGTLQFALADVRKSADVIQIGDRQQKATNDQFDRAMARAQTRMQQETS